MDKINAKWGGIRKGAGRKPLIGGKLKSITIRLPESTIHRLDQIGVRSEVIRDAIKKYIDDRSDYR